MWSAIATVVSAVVSKFIGGWFNKKNQQDAMAKAYHEKAHHHLREHIGKAMADENEYYHGNPSRLSDWVRSRSATK